jgi:Caspase domain
MSAFTSVRIKSLLIGVGLLAGLFGPASAQTQTAELDRIQAPAQALPAPEQRVALVIGNSKYENTASLPNPDNDAQSVAELLNSAGFEVISATDLTQDDMIKVVQNFSAKVAERGPNTVAMIFYAGHGVQVAGENYLIPVDAKIATPSDLINNGLRLVDLMATLETIPSRLRIVMLDSCRNNPFPNLDDSSRGLALVDAPARSIVGYSTSPGAEALDGTDGGHSPYTQAFLRLARERNLPIEELFKRLRLEVSHATEGMQTPWESSSATSDFTFFGDTAIASGRAPLHGSVVQMASNMPWNAVDQAYDYVLSEGTPEYYQEFITRFPYDPRCDRFRRLLGDLTLATAWHHAVLANSPLAYKSFYEHHADSPFATTALHLEAHPKGTPLMQAGHLFKGNGGFQPQLSLSNHARMTTMSVHGGMNMPGNGKIVNMPSHDKGGNFGRSNDLGTKPKQFDAKPQKSFTEHQSSNRSRFTNSQARMGSGMRFNSMGGGGMGGGHFGGGMGGGHFGRH